MASQATYPPSADRPTSSTTSRCPLDARDISQPDPLLPPDSSLLRFRDGVPAMNPTRWRFPRNFWPNRFKLDAEILAYQSRPIALEHLLDPITKRPIMLHSPDPAFDSRIWNEDNQLCEDSCQEAWYCLLSDLLRINNAVHFDRFKYRFSAMEQSGKKYHILRTYKSVADEYSQGKHAEVGGNVTPCASQTSDVGSYLASDHSQGAHQSQSTHQSLTFDEYDRLAARPFAAEYSIVGQTTNRDHKQAGLGVRG